MPTYGTFDNFNPFIFKGISDGGYTVSLTLDTLGVTAVDDISTIYPLIAKEFEYPSNYRIYFIKENNSWKVIGIDTK